MDNFIWDGCGPISRSALYIYIWIALHYFLTTLLDIICCKKTTSLLNFCKENKHMYLAGARLDMLAQWVLLSIRHNANIIGTP